MKNNVGLHIQKDSAQHLSNNRAFTISEQQLYQFHQTTLYSDRSTKQVKEQ